MWDHHTHGQVRLWICSNNEKCQSAGGATGNDHWRQWDLSFWNSVEYVQSITADLYKSCWHISAWTLLWTNNLFVVCLQVIKLSFSFVNINISSLVRTHSTIIITFIFIKDTVKLLHIADNWTWPSVGCCIIFPVHFTGKVPVTELLLEENFLLLSTD